MQQNQDEEKSDSGSGSEAAILITNQSDTSRAIRLTLRFLESLENVDDKIYDAGLRVFNFWECKKQMTKRQTTSFMYF